MGIVLRQGMKNTIFTYLGFLIGGIYTVLLVPKVFDEFPDHWGTARYLVSFALVIVPWAQLSIPNVIIRYFPIFREKKGRDFMFFISFWAIIGILTSLLIVYGFSDFIFADEKDPLILDNIYLIFPIIAGFVLFEIAAAIAKSNLKSTVPVFLREFILRLSIFILIIFYWFDIIEFNLFIQLYSYTYIAIFIALFVYLYYIKALKIRINFSAIFDTEFKELYIYAAFSILSTGAAMILLNIDTLMINHYLTLKDVAIYGPSIYIASSIMIPSRALQSIIAPMVAKSWVNNDIGLIKSLYKKSAIAPLSITIFLFLMIWINIDLVMDYFGKTFGQGKYIILFLSMGHIVNIATGINGTIINTSKHYRADLYFQVALVLMTVIMNIIFIPLYGLNGAALATGITLGLHNTLKSMFVLYKFKIHPFTIKTIYVMLIGALLFYIINQLPIIENLLISSLIYTFVFGFVYWAIVYFANISEDINDQINRFIKK